MHTCGLSEVVTCGGGVPGCPEECPGHPYRKCMQPARWRVTTTHAAPTDFVEEYACDLHRDKMTEAPDRACEPLDGRTLFGSPLRRSRPA